MSSVEGKSICDSSSGPRPIGLFRNFVFDAGNRRSDNRLEDVDDSGELHRVSPLYLRPGDFLECDPKRHHASQ